MKHKNLHKINSYLEYLEQHIVNQDVLNEKVSRVSVGWHIDHILKVINNVVSALEKSNPSSYQNNFKFLGNVFLKLGYFPRGKAKAPKHVKPPELILKEDLIAQLELAKIKIKTINTLDKNTFFVHPLFGNVNAKRVGRFLETHTNHHLKIIKDILNH